MPLARADSLRALRAQLSAYDPALRGGRTLSFGDARVDRCFPGGGLPLGCWHEFVGEGSDTETSAVTAAFGARLCGAVSRKGQVVWVLRREDLYAPGLAELGLGPERLVVVRTSSEAQTLAALEDALRTRGVAAAVGEIERVGLTAGRRLQLACEHHGTTGLVLKRRLYGAAPKADARPEPAISASRWRITPRPSEPLEDEPGLGIPRWEVRLQRTRGGRTGAWIMEAQDGAVPFRVVAELADHQLAAAPDPRDDLRRAMG
jgi:protein ImuA